jgi:hypothetical protein
LLSKNIFRFAGIKKPIKLSSDQQLSHRRTRSAFCGGAQRIPMPSFRATLFRFFFAFFFSFFTSPTTYFEDVLGRTFRGLANLTENDVAELKIRSPNSFKLLEIGAPRARLGQNETPAIDEERKFSDQHFIH